MVAGNEQSDLTETVRRLAEMPARTPEERQARGEAIDREAARLGMSPLDLTEMVREESGEAQAEADTGNVGGDVAQLALARLWVDLHGAEWRHVASWNAWMRWGGMRWARDEQHAHLHAMQEFLDDFVREKGIRGKLRENLLSIRTVKAVLAMCEPRPEIAARPQDFDADPFMLNTPAGMVDLRTGMLRPPDPATMPTKITGAAPVEGAGCPRFHAFLHQIMCGRHSLVDYVLDAFALALIGKPIEHILLLFLGGGRNGKSVLLKVLAQIFGDYAGVLPEGLLVKRSQQQHPTELATLKGKRLMIAAEISRGAEWDEARVKSLTGGDTITARGMNQDFYTFEPSHTLIVAANDAPKTKDLSIGMRRRLRIVPFDHVVREGEEIPDLVDQLLEEREGILQLLLDRCVARLNSGGTSATPPEVLARTEAYYDQQDRVGAFLREACIRDATAITPVRDLFRAFNTWHGGDVPMDVSVFGRQLTAHGVTPIKGGKERRRAGARLKPEFESDLFNDADRDREAMHRARPHADQEPGDEEWAGRVGPAE